MDVLKKKILVHLRHRDYTPVKSNELAKSLGVKNDELDDFKKAFEQLRDDGQVIIGSKNFVSLPAAAGRIYGIFRATTKGFGFITPNDPNAHGDLFIPANYTANAMSGDTVIAVVEKNDKRSRDGRASGKIVEIVQHCNNHFVGTITKKGDSWYLMPDGKFTEPVELDDVGAKNAQVGDKAVVEIITYPTQKTLGRGVITDLLGKSGTYKAEIDAVIRRFSLPGEFDNACQQFAAEAARNFKPENVQDRLNITGKTIITIDPQDAKDFDDAISIDKNSDGTVTLGVHIADVSYFVKEGSPLDTEAKERGNSVYLPGRVIPMLPEVLSNGVCSLQSNQPRFAKSAFITYSDSAEILKAQFANTIIRSTARLTYTEADGILNGKKTEKPSEIISLLKDMNALAKKIEARRRAAGMLHLDMQEIELDFDKSGRVIDAHPADNSYPHTIIEMFMVEANDAVAGLLDTANIPFIRRIHPDPDSLSFKALAKTLKMLGFHMPRSPDIFDLQNVINAAKGKPAAFAVNTYVLRSLARAEYSPLSIGHFALASRHYTHFTSPIRRYADLMIHRLLDLHLTKKYVPGGTPDQTELVEIGKHLSLTDRRADEAENDLKTVLMLVLFQGRIGEAIDTVISGLTNFGIFVQCLKFGIEGLIPLDMLTGDRFVFDHDAQCVHGARTGKIFHIGMPLTVRIVSVNVAARQLNVAPLPGQTKQDDSSGKKKKFVKQKGHSRKDNRKHKDRNKKRRRR
ncbi:MAG: ribonuclease R [Phycisphaerae bacterium]|jgi:ribonuclease R